MRNILRILEKKPLYISITYIHIIFSSMLPLLIIYIYSRNLTASSWGEIIFIQSLSVWFLAFIEYNFEHSASIGMSKKISANEKGAYASTVLAAKAAIFILCFVICVFVMHNGSWVLAVLLGGTQAININWLLNFYRQMHFAVIVDVITKSVSTTLIYLISSRSDNIYNLISIQIISNSLSFLICLLYAGRKGYISLFNPKEIVKIIKDNFSIFLTRMIPFSYTFSTPVLAGLFIDKALLPLIFVPDRIVKAAQTVYTPIFQYTFPVIINLIARDKFEAWNYFKKILYYTSLSSVLISVMVIAFSRDIIDQFIGKEFSNSADYLRIMAISILFTTISGNIVNRWLIPIGKSDLTILIYAMAGILQASCVVYFSKHENLEGIDATITAVDLFTVFAAVLILMKVGLNERKR